jgi:hypothetical protein
MRKAASCSANSLASPKLLVNKSQCQSQSSCCQPPAGPLRNKTCHSRQSRQQLKAAATHDPSASANLLVIPQNKGGSGGDHLMPSAMQCNCVRCNQPLRVCMQCAPQLLVKCEHPAMAMTAHPAATLWLPCCQRVCCCLPLVLAARV